MTMYSKEELKNFLREISENAQFPVFNYVSPEKYTVLVKCRVESNREPRFYSEYATKWVKRFSTFTRTGWIVRSSHPNLKRLVYRKVFVCHLSSFNKKKSPDEATAKNKECKAKIDFKMKFINRNTIRNDRLLKEGLNLNIYIYFTHSHRIKTRESLNLLKCSPETDEMFYGYFASGHTVPTAKSYHELTLLANSEGTTSQNFLTNSEINPTMHHVTYLYSKKEDSSVDIAGTMAAKVKTLEELGGVLRYTDDFSITVVITPFMKNVLTGHELDYIIIDSTPIKDGVASFFFVPTPLGALPIACALHSQITEPSFSQAFFSTKLLIENQTLKSFEPKKIMINMIDEQNHALDAIFSNKRLFISRASMAEEIWKTICEGEVKIETKHRQSLMLSFISLLHAETLKEAELLHTELEGNKQIETAPKLKELLTDVWNKREDYIEKNQNKIIDISIRILKQFLLSKCKSYNSLIMINVLIYILDGHWCQILRALLRDRLIAETYTKLLPKDRNIMKSLSDLKSTDQEYKFDLESKAGQRSSVIFRGDTMCCDCVKGRKGRLCEHLCAVLHCIELKAFIPEDKREFYTALAGECRENVKVEPKLDTEQEELANYEEETISNDDHYFIIKEEKEHIDPLDNNESIDENSVSDSIETNTGSMREKYINAMKALNDEFRRLNKMFRDNPNESNFDTMGRLARELSKIKPVEKVNFSNMYVELNENNNMNCDNTI